MTVHIPPPRHTPGLRQLERPIIPNKLTSFFDLLVPTGVCGNRISILATFCDWEDILQAPAQELVL